MATSANTDSTQLLGMIKDTWSEKYKDLPVVNTVMQERHPLDASRSPIGGAFHLPIIVTNSQSTTYDVSQGGKTLNAAVAPQSVDAQVKTFEMTEILNIPFGMMAQADMGAKVSYASDQVLKMLSLWRGAKRQLEWTLLYGQSNLATVASTSVSGSTGTITLNAGTFSPGYLSGCENAKWDCFNPALSTQRNTNAPIVITAVDTDAGTVTVSGNSTDLAAISASDCLFRLGERDTTQFYVFPGIITQLSNTASVLITNVDPTKYTLLKGNVVSAFGNAGVQKFAKYVSRAKNKGAEGEAIFLINPDVFGALSAELSQARRFDTSYEKGKLENGAQQMKVRVGSITMEFLEHPFLKSGDCALYFEDNVVRPGVKDISDSLSGEDLSVMSSTVNAYQWRVWTSQAALYNAPAQGVFYTGVTVP